MVDQFRPPAAADAQLVDLIRERALFARLETVRLISIAKTGHYASGFSCAEILATLYYGVMNLRRGEPDWPDRDRFLFGKGHAAATLYPLLADWGFFDPSELDGYTRLGSAFGDHPDMTRIPGIDFSSGSLGHALSTGTGMALGLRMQGRPSNVYVLLGDGELHEGQIWEAALAAAHHRVSNLVAIVDRNGYSLDGRVDDVTGIEPLAGKWRAFGWGVHEVDGHDAGALLTLLRSLAADPDRGRPAAVIAHTVKGKGISYMERDFGWHLGWLAEPDEIDAVNELRSAR
ncbi:transketolase [Actinomadura madurae]|uniref:transketolase n=1 Tax=Actinomadura madurae TaxID=1993 RepID=UPI0020D20603|nr:transketolase [Actinomadura madurae]MCP9955448.1 transketolase [Actinomadura madurae]MCP9972185.1 transketolase [Actinomadura madurae]MCQ0003760.1 transketolase [Actinomadura madurae]